jgi:hypothetical protein
MAIEDNKINIKVGMNTRGFQNGMKTVQGGFKKLNGAIGAFSAGFVGTQVFGVVKGLANMAGEAEKTELRFKRVFGSMSTSVSMFSSKLAGDLGRVETDVKSGMVSFQAFFQGLGFGGEEAAGMSQKMQGLSYDLASFFNIQDDNAQKRFLAALAGSPEVLDQFGINLKQAALQVELLDMGITSTVQNTDELTKTQGRLNIIMRAMTSNGIVGDAERTMNTWDNTLKRTWASLKDMGIAIGNLLIPVAKEFLEVVISLTKGVSELFNINEKEIRINQALKESYKDITDQLLRSKKGTNSSKQAIEQLNSLYPSFWKNINFATASQEELETAVALATKQFDIQADILEKQKVYKERTKELKDFKKELDKVNSKLTNRALPDASGNGGTPLRRRKSSPFGAAGEAGETMQNRLDELKGYSDEYDRLEARITIATIMATMKQNEFIDAVNGTTKAYKEHFGIAAKGIEKTVIAVGGASELEIQRQKDLLDALKRKYDLLKFIRGLDNKHIDDLKAQLTPLQDSVNYFQELVDAGLGFNGELDDASFKLSVLKQKIDAFDGLFIPIEVGFPDFKGGRSIVPKEELEDSLDEWMSIIRPIADGMGQLWDGLLTPPDNTISKEEQKEKTMSAFGGILAGVGQALFSLGLGQVTYAMGLKFLGSANPAPGIALMAVGSGLIAMGKSKMQSAKSSAHARTSGGGANGGSGVGGFSDMMGAIQGEQVFRLAGNDLVTAINRTNRFQGTIGG